MFLLDIFVLALEFIKNVRGGSFELVSLYRDRLPVRRFLAIGTTVVVRLTPSRTRRMYGGKKGTAG